MSRWADQFRNHSVHEKLGQLKAMAAKKSASKDAVEMSEIRRLAKFIKLLESRLKLADPDVTSLSLLDNIAQGLEHPNAMPEVERFVTEGSVAHIESANNHFTTLLPSVHGLLQSSYSPAESTSKDIEEHFDRFSLLIDQQQTLLSEKIASQKLELDALLGKSNELKDALTALQNDYSTASAQWNSQFIADQSSRQSEFSSAQDGKQTEFTTWFSEFKNSSTEHFNDTSKSFETQISKLIEDARLKHEAILDLHGLVAGDAVTAGYLGDGKEERKAANFWRWTTYIFILATAFWLLFSFGFPYLFKNVTIGDPWIYLAKTASLTGVLMFGAAYASRQSKSHRDHERRARWFGLEVKAFPPFISSLPDDQQQAMRQRFADRMFGQKTEPESDTGGHMDNDMLKTLSDLVIQISKQTK